jgi:acetyltransferase-like isoleucine patch superfamily enzyme
MDGSHGQDCRLEQGLMAVRIHETAIIEPNVQIGDDTAVWDNVHIRRGASVGHHCIIGEKTYIGQDVVVGDLVKLNAVVYICTGVTIERGVMVSAHVTFTNDTYPRATDPKLDALRSSEADESTLSTTVREGATIGAAAVIGPGLELGRFSMIGMGSVVTRSVEDFSLVVGNPARMVGYVCRCGSRLELPLGSSDGATTECGSCGRCFKIHGGRVLETDDSPRRTS